MKSSPQRRFVLVAVLVIGVVVGWFLFGRRPAPADQASANTAAGATNPVAATSAATAAPSSPAPSDPNPDFRFALESARRSPNPRERSQEFGRVLQRWLERDADAALGYLRLLSADALRTQGVLTALDFVSQHDPDLALRLAGELVANRDEQAFYSLLFARLAQQDVVVAVQRLVLVPPAGRENAVRALADAWARRDVSAALAWAQVQPDADRSFAVESVLLTLLAAEPLRAVQVAQSTLTGAALERTLAAVVQKLTPDDPAAAAAIATQLPPGEGRTLATVSVARAFAARDPAAALAWSKTLPDSALQRLAFNNVLDGWATLDTVAPGAYVAQMPAGRDQDAAANYFAGIVGARSPQTAIEWAHALASESAREAALIMIGSAWARHEPAAAAQWAASLPQGATQSGAVSGAYSYWLLRDPAAARAWLAAANLPASVKGPLSSMR